MRNALCNALVVLGQMGWPSLDHVLSRTPRLAYVLIVRVLITRILLYRTAFLALQVPRIEAASLWRTSVELKLTRLPELARGIAIAEVISRTFLHHRRACDVLKGAFH